MNKLMTTKFPASAVLMDHALYMKKMSLQTVVEWSPRTGNKEADRLANGDSRKKKRRPPEERLRVVDPW